MAKDLAREGIVVEARVPGCGDARAELAIVWIVGILLPIGDIACQGKTDFWVVRLAGQSVALASRQIGPSRNGLVGVVYHYDLFAIRLGGRHLQRPA